jgi:hypothetical protein
MRCLFINRWSTRVAGGKTRSFVHAWKYRVKKLSCSPSNFLLAVDRGEHGREKNQRD